MRNNPLITPENLTAMLDIPAARAAKWASPLVAACQRYGIETPMQVAAFISQIGHESSRLSRGRENLNYTTASRLKQIFGHRIKDDELDQFVRNPSGLANRVYAGRYGNGDEVSGDGYRFRGGGLIGLTFRDNYKACGESIGQPLDDQPELIEQPAVAALSAAWYWDSRHLNELADAGDIRRITRLINGGYNGLRDREAIYAKALKALEA